MKKYFKVSLIVALLFLCPIGIKSQTANSKLNQMELMKMFLGYWKCDFAKDTTRFWDVKSYGTGFECSLQIVTKGRVIQEARRLWGYDGREDKYIGLEVTKGMGIRIYAQWFISESKGVAILYSDIANPERASFKGEAEFKSPDMYIITTIVNNNPVKTDTYVRVKK
jgi:hypothetical protein